MAYFDSPKNCAIWNMRMDTLRAARESRSAGLDDYVSGGNGKQSPTAEKEHSNPQRVRVSYSQLVMEERNARQQRKEQQRTEPVRSAERDRSMAGPQR